MNKYDKIAAFLALMFIALILLAIWSEYHFEFFCTAIVFLYIGKCAAACSKDNQ